MIQFEYTIQGRSGFCEGSSVKEGVQAAKADFIYVQWGITARRNLSAFKLRMHSLKGVPISLNLSAASLRHYTELQVQAYKGALSIQDESALASYRRFMKERNEAHSF